MQESCNFLESVDSAVVTDGSCEFEVPPHTKVRVVAVVDSRLKDEMELIHKAECKVAEECDREVPDWSNTLEMLFRKGVRAYRQNAKRV